MKPELLHFGSYTVYGYGFAIFLGVLFAYLHFWWNRKSIGISDDQISTLILLCGLSVFIGGKLFFYLENPAMYLKNPAKMLDNIGDGFVFYGSFLLTILVLYFWFKYQKLSFWSMMDEVGIAGAFVHAFGKIGCYLAGCCYGLVCNKNIGIVFTDPNCRARPLNMPLFPVQLWDAAIVFTAIALMYWKRKNKDFGGQLFFIYAIFYGIGRVVTEEFRGDVSRGFLFNGSLSHSQFIGILVILSSLLGYYWLGAKKSKSTAEVN